MNVKMAWKQHWKLCIAIGLFVLTISFFYISFQPVGDLNEINNVPVRNTDWHRIYDDRGEPILLLWPIINVTTEDHVSVWFWYNSTYIRNVTIISFAYYNGTHSSDLPANKTYENGYPNFHWWTHTTSLLPNMFVNRSQQDPIRFTIPKQPANTTVEFRVFLGMNEAGNTQFKWWGGNFTVRFSDADNAEMQLVHSTYWRTLGGISFMTLLSLCFANYITLQDRPTALEPLRKEAKRIRMFSSQSASQSDYPKLRDLIDRAEKLESMKTDLRTASSLLLGLATALLYLVGVRFMYISTGLGLLILTSLGSIVLSLTGSHLKYEESEIDESLLPFDKNKVEFSLLLRMVIIKRRQVLFLMRTALELGVAMAMIGFLVEFVEPFSVGNVGILQSSQFTSFWTIDAGILFRMLVLITIVLVVWAILRAFGITDWEHQIIG
ncbi:MAG: hypothetical protein ACTSWA_07420 [Candidatus Thorarchaeota archaeon]